MTSSWWSPKVTRWRQAPRLSQRGSRRAGRTVRDHRLRFTLVGHGQHRNRSRLARDADELLRDADIALYAAKAAGKNRAVVFAPSMQDAVDDHRNLELDLQKALECGEFFLLYQPVVDLVSGAVIGVEALLRWQHPVRGMLPPDSFVPELEVSGLIVPVGRWVLEEACRQGAEWQKAGHRFTVAINVSARQMERDQIVDDVRRALHASDFDPSLCILELTESTLMNDIERTVLRLSSLKKLGVRLAVDDFGTGYLSLSYLRQFPIDILKIDKSFVSGVADTEEDAALVHSMVMLGAAAPSPGRRSPKESRAIASGVASPPSTSPWGRDSSLLDRSRRQT